MEKLTPTKFSQVREMKGTNGVFYKVGFQTREFGERWFNVSFNKDNPLQTGKTFELEVTPRKYTDKNGKEQTAYDCRFPSKEREINKALLRHEQEIGKLWTAIHELQNTRTTEVDIPVVQDEHLEFDESGAPIVTEPDLSDLPF